MNKDSQISPRDFSEAVQELREEIRNDVRKLGHTIERRSQVRPGVSPMGVFASVVGALCVGAAGMSIYQSSQTADDVQPEPALKIADIERAIKPQTEQFVSTVADFNSAQQKTTQELDAQRIVLDRLSSRLVSLEETAASQDEALHNRVDELADEIVATISRQIASNGKVTTTARQPLPETDDSQVQQASAEAEIDPSSEVSDEEKDLPLVPIARGPEADSAEPNATTANKPEPNKPQRGELIINNPSNYDLKLLINGESMDIKARGITTIDVTVGTVKTQPAAVPEYVKTWNDWKEVDGVKRLTITVEGGNGTYYLR